MALIDLAKNAEKRKNAIRRAREKNIIVPTLAEQKNPNSLGTKVKNDLKAIGLWDISPRNLFRITWKNDPIPHGGGFGKVNYLELPHELTGVEARILCLVGKWFPTGAHKVGAAF